MPVQSPWLPSGLHTPTQHCAHTNPAPLLCITCCPPYSPPAAAGAKQAEEILGADALEVAALYDQLAIIRFLHERMEEAAEAGGWVLGGGWVAGFLGARSACTGDFAVVVNSWPGGWSGC